MAKNVHTKRRKRHRAKSRINHGINSVRKHMKVSGRTGAVHHKRLKSRHGKKVKVKDEDQRGRIINGRLIK